MKKMLLLLSTLVACVVLFMPMETRAAQNQFTDVPSDKFYAQPVSWAVERGITSGTSSTTFSPIDSCTRGQCMTFLYRAMGASASPSAKFSDVPVDKFYSAPVTWAVQNDITSGTSPTTFGPMDTCTRAQIVTFLWRAAGCPEASSYSNFSDVPADKYYSKPVAWAVSEGITSGTSSTTFSPSDSCTRAQIVTFLYRAMNKQEKPDPESISDRDFETHGYLYEDSIGSSFYYLVVKNNTTSTVSISGNATALDDSGRIIGADDMSINVLGPGEQTIGYFYFDDVSNIADVDYQLNYNEKLYYKPILSSLRMEQSINEKNVVVSLTNTGNIAGEFVQAYALFFDSNNKVVDVADEYFIDADDEIKPGYTISDQLDTYQTFDHVQCYLVGRSDGSSGGDSTRLPLSDYDIREYRYQDSIESTHSYLVMKNNSNKTVGIYGNSKALNVEGKIVGADDCAINVLGPGETTITEFYYSDVSNIDHIEYWLSCYEPKYYKPVISDIAVTEHVNERNVVLQLTNRGMFPAEFVTANVLFFDSNNQVVDYDYQYAVDADYEIKPGVTMPLQFNTSKDFDHIEYYLTGRR